MIDKLNLWRTTPPFPPGDEYENPSIAALSKAVELVTQAIADERPLSMVTPNGEGGVTIESRAGRVHVIVVVDKLGAFETDTLVDGRLMTGEDMLQSMELEEARLCAPSVQEIKAAIEQGAKDREAAEKHVHSAPLSPLFFR